MSMPVLSLYSATASFQRSAIESSELELNAVGESADKGTTCEANVPTLTAPWTASDESAVAIGARCGMAGTRKLAGAALRTS